MFKAKCPNCKHIVDVKLGHCTNCDYNISKFMEEIGFCKDNQIKAGYLRICPKCGLNNNLDYEDFYCSYCHHTLQQTDMTIEEFDKIKFQMTSDELNNYLISKYVKDSVDLTLYLQRRADFEKNIADIERERQKYNNQVQQKANAQCKPTCPTCGSTNIEKIHTASKILGAVSLGLLSKTAKSQFVCHNCGYKW